MGGYAALALYQIGAAIFDGLVLANTRAGADSPESRANRRNMLALVDREGPSGVAREMMPKLLGKTTHETNTTAEATVRRLIKQQSPVAIRGAIHRMMHRPDSTPLLAQVSVPTLVITGAEDEMIPVEESRRIAERDPRREAGHHSRRRASRESRAARGIQRRAERVSFRTVSHESVCHGSADRARDAYPALPCFTGVARRSPTPADVEALHRPFDEILDVYVRDGLVYYFALKQERGKLDRYVQALGDVTADTSRAGRPSASWRTGSTPTTRSCCAR